MNETHGAKIRENFLKSKHPSLGGKERGPEGRRSPGDPKDVFKLMRVTGRENER